ncbi:hypothetical protein FNV43_RR02620 [Rhamnella rubrinervis]|uniref:F-box protein n=1 Tax=Rhamnella rubrinervis TaxID=2594499 RepID=A0A8K0MTW5_9ROSA|nr:hypothetical protein FNV43_RR02620 [Rhamnella rubrinervis]
MAKSSRSNWLDLSSSLLSNWACLCNDLLISIIEKLVHRSDFIWFSNVCKSWNSVALNHRKQKLNQLSNHQIPWQLTRSCDETNPSLCNYLPNTSPTIFNIKLRIPSKYKTSMWRRYGSSHGWLVFMEKTTWMLVLLNPLSGATIHLPPFIDSPLYIFPVFGRVILSRDPSLGSDFEVLFSCAIYVAHLKFGDKFWTSKIFRDSYSPAQSLIFYKDQIIGVSTYSEIMCLDVISGDNGSGRIEFRNITPKCSSMYFEHCFLSETTFGDLLVVCRRILYKSKYKRYKVYKLIESDGQVPRLVPVDNLDGNSIYLDEKHNQSISVLASNYVGYCRPNSIYYQHVYFQKSEITFKYYEVVAVEEFNLLEDRRRRHLIPISLETFWVVPSMFSQLVDGV